MAIFVIRSSASATAGSATDRSPGRLAHRQQGAPQWCASWRQRRDRHEHCGTVDLDVDALAGASGRAEGHDGLQRTILQWLLTGHPGNQAIEVAFS